MLRADEPSSTAILLTDDGYERFDVVQAAEGDEAEGDKAEGKVADSKTTPSGR